MPIIMVMGLYLLGTALSLFVLTVIAEKVFRYIDKKHDPRPVSDYAGLKAFAKQARKLKEMD